MDAKQDDKDLILILKKKKKKGLEDEKRNDTPFSENNWKHAQ